MAASFLKEFLENSGWQQMQNALKEAGGAPVLWVVSESGRSMQKTDEHYPDLCQLIRGSPEGPRRCRNSHRSRFQEVKRSGKPVVSECFCGFVGFALPLTLNDGIIGVAGGCHHRTVSPITMEKCAELSASCSVDLKEVMNHARTIKHMPKVEQRRLLTTLSLFADMVSIFIRCKNEMNALFPTLNTEDDHVARLSLLSEIVKLAASELDREEMPSGMGISIQSCLMTYWA